MVQYEDVSTGQLRSMAFTDQHLAVVLRLMSYSSYGTTILPSMLYEAIENDNFAPLARQSLLQTNSLDSILAAGMHNAVICTEDVPFVDQNMDRELDKQTFLGTDFLDALLINCKAWPQGVRDDDFKSPLTADVPTLILSGEADPITPPAYGERVAESLPQARHIVNSYQGHMQAPLGCVPNVMAEFVAKASVDSLTLSCLDRLRPPAFFVDANGPLP